VSESFFSLSFNKNHYLINLLSNNGKAFKKKIHFLSGFDQQQFCVHVALLNTLKILIRIGFIMCIRIDKCVR
jgi:hypothetical protein